MEKQKRNNKIKRKMPLLLARAFLYEKKIKICIILRIRKRQTALRVAPDFAILKWVLKKCFPCIGKG
jgi:hypothetical protein